ncbi:hypothetical protein ABW19_dt0207206 [Dactylella cylindrospora]|nr:hypothetical protein ABW19_dt0207206 [Dactylella cylindrospora]
MPSHTPSKLLRKLVSKFKRQAPEYRTQRRDSKMDQTQREEETAKVASGSISTQTAPANINIKREPISPSPFLLLPREIRDAIYHQIYEICMVPSKASIYPENADERLPLALPWAGSSFFYIHYPKSYPRYTLLPILQTNSQIRQEFLEFLERERKRVNIDSVGSEGIDDKKKQTSIIRYELDIIAPCRRGPISLTPTWTVLPLPPEAPNNIIEELKINYHVTNFAGKAGGNYYGCGGPGLTSYVLFRLLNDFIFHGPQWYFDAAVSGMPSKGSILGRESDEDEKEKRRFDSGRCQPFVKTMIFDIDFEYQEGYPKNKPLSPEEGLQIVDPNDPDTPQTVSKWRFEEQTVASHVGSWMTMLNSYGYLSNKVGKVVILLKGHEVWMDEWDFEQQKMIKGVSAFCMNVEDAVGGPYGDGWQPSQEFENYGFKWGRKEHSVRKGCDGRFCKLDIGHHLH